MNKNKIIIEYRIMKDHSIINKKITLVDSDIDIVVQNKLKDIYGEDFIFLNADIKKINGKEA